MVWTIPTLRDKAYEELTRRVERIPAFLPEPHYDPPMTYFNNSKSYSSVVPYDIFYNFEEGYDPKSRRDDRKSLGPIFENIFKEEERKFIPVTNQLWYGRPWLFDNAPDFCERYERTSFTNDFYSNNGANLSPELEQQPSLDLLICFFVVTIPLENHGELTSRARCVPLQYLSSATRGVKQALNSNIKPQNQNSIVVSTLLQERKTEKVSNPLKAESQSSGQQVSQTESGMYYELSNKRRMECERYQDCSWFQQDSMKGNISSTLSLAEGAGPISDTNEFDLAMQFANAQSIPWGDEYLEVFDDDIFLEVNSKMGDKTKNPSNDYYAHVNSKTGEDGVWDTYNINFSLKKTDSFDSMKNISSTNPAEIIPISYKEKLNNSNYGPTVLSDIKCEVKEEVELYSPESNNHIMESDDSDLNIGREEIVEEVNSNECGQDAIKKEKINFSPIVSESLTGVLPVVKNTVNLNNQDNSTMKGSKVNETIKFENYTQDTKVPDVKLDLNLDLGKVGFEQSMNVSTPDLDFMDLVEYINEELHQEHGNPTATQYPQTKFPSNQNLQSKDISNIENIQPVNPDHNSVTQNKVSMKKAANDEMSSEEVGGVEEKPIVDFTQVSDRGVSIAERIKTSAKRRTLRKYNLEDVKEEGSSSEEDLDFYDDDDDDNDDDYDYAEATGKRRFAPLRKRSKSSASESSSSGKKPKDDLTRVDSYRERRDKNNEASRRSRQNRKDRERQMFQSLEEEERKNVKLKAESEVLEKQVASLRQLLLQVVLKKGNGT